MSELIHRDHRSRMKARFAAQGLDGLNDHEALELLLYFAVPRWTPTRSRTGCWIRSAACMG